MNTRSIVSSLLLLLAVSGTAWGQGGTFDVACAGSESQGGGIYRYQYIVRNTGNVPQVLTLFYLGTQDLFVPDYTNWVAPPGFTQVGVVAPWAVLGATWPVALGATTGVKTPHGVSGPVPVAAAAGGILWHGAAVLVPGQAVLFGFNNLNPSWDMEWFAEHPGGASVSQGFPGLPIAGPLGVFSQGFVHGPAPPIYSSYCNPAVPNSTGLGAHTGGFGSLFAVANNLTLVASNLPMNQFGYFLGSPNQNFVVGPGGSQGNLCVGPTIGRFNLQIQNSGLLGLISVPINLTAIPTNPSRPVLPGQTWNFQLWYRDFNPTPTSNFSNGASILFM